MNYTDALSLPSRAAVEELQLAKLQQTLAEIYRRNRFYTNKLDQAGINSVSRRYFTVAAHGKK